MKSKNWYYCRTNENPADILTRVDGYKRVRSDLWYKGSKFSPTSDVCVQEEISTGGDESIEFQKELKVEKVSNMIVTSTETVSMDNLINIKKFSDFNEIISNNKLCGAIRAKFKEKEDEIET